MIGNRLVGPVHQSLYADGADVMAQDWDNLIVLDACREDLFREVADISEFDEYKTLKSRGSCTPEWTRNNFANRSFGDTIYVSANPWVSKIASDSWHDLYEVWETDFDDEIGTVPPERVTRTAKDAFDESKRLIVHYIQPHWPFIGQINDQEPKETPNKSSDVFQGIKGSPWKALANKKTTREDVWDGYKENLKCVLTDARQLAEDLPGKSVITSDHGNLLGSRPSFSPISVYGHPCGLREPDLITMPWAVVQDDRRNTTQGSTSSHENDDTTVNNRLSDLGYL